MTKYPVIKYPVIWGLFHEPCIRIHKVRNPRFFSWPMWQVRISDLRPARKTISIIQCTAGGMISIAPLVQKMENFQKFSLPTQKKEVKISYTLKRHIKRLSMNYILKMYRWYKLKRLSYIYIYIYVMSLCSSFMYGQAGLHDFCFIIHPAHPGSVTPKRQFFVWVSGKSRLVTQYNLARCLQWKQFLSISDF